VKNFPFNVVKFGLIATLVLSLVAPTYASEIEKSSNWSMSGQNLHNTRYQANEEKISTANVNSLVQKWVFTTGGDISATPAVEGKYVYVPDWAGNLFKIDTETGQQVWSHRISDYNGIANSISRTSPVVSGDSLIIGDLNGAHIICINKKTGKLIWIKQVDDHAAAVITSSPIVYENHIYVGVSSTEENLDSSPNYKLSFRGSVVALDVESGNLVWKTYTVPEGYTGGAVWSSTPVVDEERGSLYITTGNNYSVPQDVQEKVMQDPTHPGKYLAHDNYMDSILSLDIDSGVVKWGKRLEGYDAWTLATLLGKPWAQKPESPDYDFGAGANLFTTKINGKKRDLVGAGQKSGVYWALDPDSGDVIWSTLVGPGGTLGGIQWGTATDNKRVYVAISNNGRKSYNLPSGQTVNGGSWAALDSSTGEILWQVADPNGSIDPGAVSAANNVVYAGSIDGHMYGFDSKTGNILWSFNSNGAVNSGAAISDGTIYWGSGYSRFNLGAGNNKLYAFTLPKHKWEPSDLISIRIAN
jgi:polyvinyl alcohol dehydrogenase (cytochrome)